MLNKYTFGKTPAAVYLADHINQLSEKENTKILIKKIGHLLSTQREILKQLENSNAQGILSTHNLSNIINAMRKGVHFNVGGELVSNLVTNILVGEMKTVIRKSTQVRLIELHQNKKVKNKPHKEGDIYNKKGYKIATVSNGEVILEKYNVQQVKDSINAQSLDEKQSQKMKRKGIDKKW